MSLKATYGIKKVMKQSQTITQKPKQYDIHHVLDILNGDLRVLLILHRRKGMSFSAIARNQAEGSKLGGQIAPLFKLYLPPLT